MSPIDRTPPAQPARNTNPLPPATLPPAKAVKPQTDAIKISIDARARLGKDNQPELVVDEMTVDGGNVQETIDANAKGRSAGVRRQVTEQVVAAIAEQVSKAIEPLLEEKLAASLEAEHLPPKLAHELAIKAMPQIAHAIAEQLAKKVNVTYSLGR
ncbi:MAG: hypothetical protein JWM80_4341 [Cyanobacteria bacterium RYN_339]|nr:hypothetical protein [Cyanobacteria bacterium RYN_339]